MQGRLENLLGALSTALGDDVRDRTQTVVGHGPSAPAAILSLYRRPHQSVESLRRAIGLSHSATVRLVDHLEHDGLVVRRTAADGREVSLVLTGKGRRRTDRIHEERRRVLGRAVVGLSRVERRQLETLLGVLLRNQALAREDPTPICRLCELPVCPVRRCPVPGAR